jgi:hypothetical protein
MNKEVYKELEQNKDFLIEYINLKLDDICYHLSVFFQYLTHPRKNVKTIVTQTGQATKDLDLSINTVPKISIKMVYYLFNDIYNCKNYMIQLKKEDIMNQIIKFIISVSNSSVQDRLIKNIQRLTDGKFHSKNILIQNDVSNLVHKYVASSILNLMQIRGGETLQDKYNNLQMYVAVYKRNDLNYLDNQMENLTCGAFLHLIICLTDWLNNTEVSRLEINTSLNFILTKEMRNEYKGWFEEYMTLYNKKKNDATFKNIYEMTIAQIIYIFNKYDLSIDIKEAEILVKHIYIIINNINKGVQREDKSIIDNFVDLFQQLFSL